MIWFVYEEHNQIPDNLGLPQSSIYILTTVMPLFDKSEHSPALKYLADFLEGYPVLGANLLDDRIQPDDSPYLHSHLRCTLFWPGALALRCQTK